MENNESYEDLDEQAPVVDLQLEEKIKLVIVKIKEKRSRPCYQNILTFMNRGSRGNNKSNWSIWLIFYAR